MTPHSRRRRPTSSATELDGPRRSLVSCFVVASLLRARELDSPLVVDRCGAQTEPAVASVAAAWDRRLPGGGGAHASLQVSSVGEAARSQSARQVAGEEVAHPEPAVTGGGEAIARPVHGEEGVPSAVVPMELMDPSQLGEPTSTNW